LHFAELNGTTGFQAVTSGAGQPGNDAGWGELIQPYIKSRQLFQCPSETNPPAAEGANGAGYTDYMANVYDINAQAGTLAGLVATAQTVLAVDWQSAYSGSSFAYNYLWSPVPAESATTSQFYRHLSGDNFLFTDGHVKWLKPEAVRSRAGATAYTCGAGGTASPTTWTYTFCAN
jgi:prepilin-type processing-associated H-X9-DG protein